jgi:glycosyltransferase involved in cell wall biosynthesis
VKILNLIQCANLGGMEQASLRLMRGLQKRGDSLQLLSLNPIGQLGPLLKEAGIPHQGLPYLGKGGWRSYGLLKERLKAVEADGMVMTGHHLLGSLAVGDFCKGHRILAIHYHHAGVKLRFDWRLIYRMACRRFDAITFPCDFIRKEAEAIFSPVSRLAYTIRNPLDVPSLPAMPEKVEARKILNLPLDRPIIGNAGWLIPRKRFDVFLRVAGKILNKNPDVLFAIAGDGIELANLQKLANELGVAANVRWLGWQQEMANFYKSLDVLLFNSDWDALGLTPLEAMSFGVPVVCSVLNGGLSEILNSEHLGFLLPDHNVDAMADLVLNLLNQPAKATAIGLAGRAHVQTVCDPAPIVGWHAQALAGRIPDKTQTATSGYAVPMEKKRTTVILFHRVGPYHFARVQAAGRVMKTTLIEVFRSDDVYGWNPVPGADGFDRLTLFDHPQKADEIIHGIQATLDDCEPEAVAIPGWADAVAFSAVQWCVTNRVPVIVMSETTEWDEPRLVWKEWIKRRVLKMCATGFVGGRPHAEYLARLGMPKERIFLGYDAVDNSYFADKAAEIRSQELEIRKQYGLPEKYFLASARFVEKKNLPRLIEAYAHYRTLAEKKEIGKRKIKIWDLVLLGDGPLKPALLNLIDNLGLRESVRLFGFKQCEELPAFYALAKVFVHASTTEQWGLVVNEAMASGLPVLVSNRCGCAQDLVQEGVNGFTFNPYAPEQLAGLMLKISDANFPLPAFGSESRRIIANWGPDRFANGLIQAVETARTAPRPQIGALDRVLLESLSRK